ncbi:MAG: nucleoside deaminase [Myxococcales bacterium]|nr:nucleoside deaminase [Myxococcales bacterium]
MQQALLEAQAAFSAEEVPVGCVVVSGGQIIARAHNLKESLADPTAHAEMLALREAARVLGRWRLAGCSLYVTMEPCPMCVGGMLSARVDRLVFGCADPKAGAAVSLFRLADDGRLNHRMRVEGGLLAEEAGELLKKFFAGRRRRGSDL